MSSPHDRPTPRDTQIQYGRQARLYAESSLHGGGESLEAVRRLAAATAADTALDLGTGTGFTAFALAETAGRVVAADLTAQMLDQAHRIARERGLEGNIDWVLAAAERLPVPDNRFAVITCRYAAHHFHDLPRSLRELARVIDTAGRIVICDVVAPEAPGMPELMNEWEQIRDPTHVWDYTLTQWRNELLPAAGLGVREVVAGKNPQLFSEWVQRAGTPRPAVEQLVEMFTAASQEARQVFEVRSQGAEITFSWPNATILATKR